MVSDDRAPRMSNLDYFRFLDRAANATSEAEVERIRAEVMQRWRGDPRADDLTEALYAHKTRFQDTESYPHQWGIGEETRAERRPSR